MWVIEFHSFSPDALRLGLELLADVHAAYQRKMRGKPHAPLGEAEAVRQLCTAMDREDAERLKAMGRGTQRVEETLAARFPAARIVRIDRDTARRRHELTQTLQAIRRGEGDILVGTQLLAKGHDFPNLTFVAVLNADHSLLSTDYRAAERLFAVLSQVAGRAGRRAEAGEVIVQTRYPDHPLFSALARHDFAGFADSELRAREQAGFPPCVFEAALRAEADELARDQVAVRLMSTSGLRAWKTSPRKPV